MRNNKNRINSYPRGRLRGRRKPEIPEPFSPTVSVERPIIWQSEEAKKDYWKAIHRALGKSLPRNQRPYHHIVRPENMSVVQIQPQPLANKSLDIHRLDQRQAAMERLAYMLQERLYHLLQDVPAQLSIGLGSLACVDLQQTTGKSSKPGKRVIAAELTGWRGPKAKYTAHNTGGDVSVLHQLAAEDKLYREAILETNPWFIPGDIVADPSIPVIQKRRSTTAAELYLIESGFLKEGVLPQPALLGDPLIRLQTGDLGSSFTELSVRELGNYSNGTA